MRPVLLERLKDPPLATAAEVAMAFVSAACLEAISAEEDLMVAPATEAPEVVSTQCPGEECNNVNMSQEYKYTCELLFGARPKDFVISS